MRCILSACLGATLLASCSGLGSPVAAPGVDAVPAFRSAAAPNSGPLLYVAHGADVAIVSLQNGKTAAISGFTAVGGVCSDASGNVWVPNSHGGVWYVDKFAPGGTTHIAELRVGRAAFLVACAVNPNNGDLAVGGYDKVESERVWVWNAARKSTVYALNDCPQSVTYDGADNLFVSGWACGTTFDPYLGELRAAASRFRTIHLSKQAGPLGGIQWDGTYLTIAVAAKHSKSELYRVQVTGNTGEVVGTVRLSEFNVCCWGQSTGLFALVHGAVIGEAQDDEQSVMAWRYPAGGKPLRTIGTYANIEGIAVSL